MTALLLAIVLQEPKVDFNVVYSRTTGEELAMDIYRPATDGTNRPGVVVIHGGGWTGGQRQDMKGLAEALAKQGFVAATVSYRLAPKYRWPAMLDDVQTAVRFLRASSAKYGIDPKRMASLGASAGGHLALFLGSRPTRIGKPDEYGSESSRVQVVYNIFGPVDMTLKSDWPAYLDPLFQTVLGKPRKDATAELQDASPINFIDKNTAPVFTIHGLEDKLVMPNQAKVLTQRLESLGIEHETVLVPKMGHAIDMNNPQVVSGLERGVRFLKTVLGLKS